MSRPHSHPAHRERGTFTQKQWDEQKAIERAEADKRDASLSDEAKERSDRWMRELDAC